MYVFGTTGVANEEELVRRRALAETAGQLVDYPHPLASVPARDPRSRGPREGLRGRADGAVGGLASPTR